MTTTTTHVYHLVDPRCRTVRYVGKTAQPKSRLRAHIQEAQQAQNTEKKRWIAELLSLGLQPVLVVAATCPNEPQARVIESRHCHQHAATIYNIHDPAKGAGDLKRRSAEGQPE
jgi:hypothetical protein